MRQRWVMLVAASVALSAAACAVTPGLGTNEEPEMIPHTQSTPSPTNGPDADAEASRVGG